MRIATGLRLAMGVLCTGAISLGLAQAQQNTTRKSILERIEWTWAQQPENSESSLPNVLLLGDSITRAYYPKVAKLLNGRANCYLFATSAASGDPRLSSQIRNYFAMMHLRFAVIHFNNGMHGWGYTDSAYAAGLPGLVETLRAEAPSAKLLWASTTPVHARDSSGATNARIDKRNAAALSVMRRFHIPLDDQHGLMSRHDNLHNGNVHYSARGSTLQAKQAVRLIEMLLNEH